jgi:hypothetical protein
MGNGFSDLDALTAGNNTTLPREIVIAYRYNGKVHILVYSWREYQSAVSKYWQLVNNGMDCSIHSR